MHELSIGPSGHADIRSCGAVLSGKRLTLCRKNYKEKYLATIRHFVGRSRLLAHT